MFEEWIRTHTNGKYSLCIHCWIFLLSNRYQNNPRLDHWKAAKKVLRYLQGMKDYMLTYKRFDHLKVIGYLDSNFVGCIDIRKSTFGYLFLSIGEIISWKSTKQSIIVASTMKVEFVACFEPLFMDYGYKTLF